MRRADSVNLRGDAEAQKHKARHKGRDNADKEARRREYLDTWQFQYSLKIRPVASLFWQWRSFVQVVTPFVRVFQPERRNYAF